MTALAGGGRSRPYADEVGAAAYAVSADGWSPYDTVYDLGSPREPRRTYLVATTQRSGSHLLAHSLAHHGAGVPLEYANPFLAEIELMRRGQEVTVDARRALLEEVRSRRTTTDGLFGLKAHWHHWEGVLGDEVRLRLLEPRAVIHVHRRDILSQAVSLAFSRRTGSWISFHARRPLDPGVFDAAAIDDALAVIAHEQHAWEAWFDRAGLSPLRLCFDHIVADPERISVMAAEFLGAGSFTPARAKVPLALPQRQDDDVKREWLALARLEFGPQEASCPRAACCA